MKISTKSWHFRYNYWLDGFVVADNLCQYFWKTIGNVLLAAIIFLVVVTLIIVACHKAIVDPWGFAIFLCLLGCIICPIVAIELLRAVFPPEKSATIKPDNILGEYCKAFKGKYCPRIEYIDPED